jgi:biotin synthase
MLTYEDACRLKEAGCHSYNHNLDTSETYYPSIVTTRTYRDRIDTIHAVQKAGLHVCCGGIIGLGESHQDRIDLLRTLASFSPHPDSVPINALIPIEGTPLASRPKVPSWEVLRMVATTRILLPQSRIRLSAGRLAMTDAEQALCFLAGANSIHSSGKLLTEPTHTSEADQALLALLGLIPEGEMRETNA